MKCSTNYRLANFPLAVLAIVLLTVAIRVPALQHPQAIDDEAVYSVVANEMIDGGRPYVDAVERKPPLLFWTYAAIFKMAGKYNWPALHVVALLWTLATMAGLYLIGRELFDRNTGLIAALLYSIFQPWATAKNLALNGELLMNLPIVWAWAIALRRGSSRLRPELLAAGALLGAAFLLKQPAAIAAVPLGVYLLLPAYRANRRITWTGSIIQAAMLTIGFFATLGGVALLLWKQGILREAYYWTITAHSIQHFFWDRGVLFTLMFVGCCLPLLIGAALSLRDRAIWMNKRAEKTALLGLLIASAIGTAAGVRFYPHYYIQLIPPLALFSAASYAALFAKKSQPLWGFIRPSVVYISLALTVVAFSISHWAELSTRRKSSDVGRYLLEKLAPGERIFVWGTRPANIYLEAQARPACRYILTFPLTGRVFGGPLYGVDMHRWIIPGAWNNLEQDFNKHPPTYIVDLRTDHDPRYQIKEFPILTKLLAERYQVVASPAEGVIYRMRSSSNSAQNLSNFDLWDIANSQKVNQ